MSAEPVITLTTDFGYEDPYAGVMKGVILTINHRVTIIDITHGIRPHDIADAAFTIGMNYRFFPEGTIHVVVVDPGVGSERRALIVSHDRHYFIGPDNGVFSYLCSMRRETATHVYHITATHYYLPGKSPTFQGRDVFSPVAAWFSKGIGIEKFGDPISDHVVMPLPLPSITAEKIRGEVVHIDRFGNAITNIARADFQDAMGSGGGHEVIFRGAEVPLRRFYAEARGGELAAVFNSSDRLEFFVRGGSAAEKYGIATGDAAEIIFPARR